MKKHFLTLLLFVALGLVATRSYGQTIYVRLEYSNYRDETGGPSSAYMDSRGDLDIKLYSDAACTTPYVVGTTPVTVAIHQENFVTSPFGPGYSDDLIDYQITNGNSSYRWATDNMFVQASPGWLYTMVETITTDANSSTYTIEPTVYNP